MVEDFVSVVRGGTSESITALLSKKLPTPELMRLWGEGVQFNPDFIRRTVSAFFSPPIFFSHHLLLFHHLIFLSVLAAGNVAKYKNIYQSPS